MTTNIERAEKAIQELTGTGALGKNAAQAIAQSLANAGLLMADLPEPDDGEWEEGRSVISVDDEGFILPSINSRPTHPERARRIAYALLAAANHAEQEQDNV